MNSSVNEEEILNTIKHSFPIQLPKAREWWDFSFEENDIFYPDKDLGKNTDRDYYFLIINKNDPKDIFINSLKNSILSALAESVKLRANIYLAFKEFFGGFFVSIRH